MDNEKNINPNAERRSNHAGTPEARGEMPHTDRVAGSLEDPRNPFPPCTPAHVLIDKALVLEAAATRHERLANEHKAAAANCCENAFRARNEAATHRRAAAYLGQSQP